MYIATYEMSSWITQNALLHNVYHRLVCYFSKENLISTIKGENHFTHCVLWFCHGFCVSTCISIFLIIFYISCIQWYHMMKKYFKMSLKRTSCRNDYYLLHHSDSHSINLYSFIIGIACVCVSRLILKLYLGNDFHAIILIINKIQ